MPVRAKFAVKKRIIGIDGMKEEIIESRIRAITSIEPSNDFRLPWQKVTVYKRNRIYVRVENTIYFFEETENAVALEDYMRAKGLDSITLIMITGGNVKIHAMEDIRQIRGIYWLTKEMWKSLKERLNSVSSGMEAEEEEEQAVARGLPDTVEV